MLGEPEAVEVSSSTDMKESLANQILNSMMASEYDWFAQSPIPSAQPPQQLEVDVLEGQLDTDERLPIFYNSDLEQPSLLDLELAEVTPAVTLEVTSQLEEPCASTSAWDMQYSAQQQQQQQQQQQEEDLLDAGVFLPELEASLDLDSSCTGSDVFERSRSTSCSSSIGQGDVKEELKHRIRSKRMASGQGEIAVEFTPPEPEKLTEEEEKLRLERKEKNRLAAQKCRNKKRERAEDLEHDIKRLTTRKQELQDIVENLRDEKEKLEQIIDVHGSVCPKMRRLSKP